MSKSELKSALIYERIEGIAGPFRDQPKPKPPTDPVAFRYRWKLDGEWTSWRVSDASQKCSGLKDLEEQPLYAKKPDGCEPCSYPECGCWKSPTPEMIDAALNAWFKSPPSETDQGLERSMKAALMAAKLSRVQSKRSAGADVDEIALNAALEIEQLDWGHPTQRTASIQVVIAKALRYVIHNEPQPVEVPTVEAIERIILIEFLDFRAASRAAAERVWTFLDARAKTLARQTTTSVLPRPEGQGSECDGGLHTSPLSRPEGK